MRSNGARYARFAGALAAVGAAAIAYWPILHSYFWLDDFAWLYLVTNRPTNELLFTQMGGHVLILGNAIFTLLHTIAGLDPRVYFACVLATHLMNVLLLFRLTWLLGGRTSLATFASFLSTRCSASVCPAAAWSGASRPPSSSNQR